MFDLKFKYVFNRLRSMGTWSFYLTKDEEKYIKRLVAEKKYRSVYSFIKHATRSLIASSKKTNDEEKNEHWWKQHKNKAKP